MKTLFSVLCWLLAIIVFLLATMILLLGGVAQGIISLLIGLVVLPPGRRLLDRLLGKKSPAWAWPVYLLILVGCFALIGYLTRPSSIYKSPAIKERILEIYAEKMKSWPVPYQSRFVDTSYGKVHVIVSGPQDGPALMLLHASGVAGWSWKFNVAQLAAAKRVYAIDLIGDFGRSQLTSFEHHLESGDDQARLYAEISDALGLDSACVVGASEGGFIATNFALRHPQRVSALVLAGPMGYSGAIESGLRITFAQMFPFESVQESTFRWAFSDNPQMLAEFGEWFKLLMTGYNPAKPMPLPFSAEQRQSLKVPTMFLFGSRDNLVGDPQKAKQLVQDIHGVRVEILDAGHLVCGEQPQKANQLIIEFCAAARNADSNPAH